MWEENNIRKLAQAIATIREVDPTIPIQAVAAFLYIAINKGHNVNTVAEKTNMAQSAASRNISSLSNWDWRKKPGLNLIKYHQDSMNLSQKTLFLTDKGRDLIAKIANILE